jgi:hypothetical protein
MRRLLTLTVLLLPGLSPLASQEQAAFPDGVWKLETIVLKEGKQSRGLLQSRTDRQIDFAEIVQRPGKPTFAIVRGIDPAQVARVELLPPKEHESLVERFRQLRYRAVIEAGRMEEVRLAASLRGSRPVHTYEGDWFTLVSSADEESTRRCVVRIEQIFRAFRVLLPPREESPRRLTIDLYASGDELRRELESLELNVEAPALYSLRQARILAASELSDYELRLAQVRRQAKEFERKYEELEKAFGQGLAKVGSDLKDAGFGKEEIAAELTLRKSAWKKEKEEALLRAREQMRRNEGRFSEVTAAMFRRLDHEALHAYLDAFVYPSDRYHVPQWLHEGLAQVFESGQLEGDSLRLDAPDPAKLAQLQAELRSAGRLPLAELLIAEGNSFAGRHDPNAGRRHYLYAWGIAHQLVFRENILAGGALEKYLAAGEGLPPAERFERLVGRPLPEWESQWRDAMLALPAPAR